MTGDAVADLTIGSKAGQHRVAFRLTPGALARLRELMRHAHLRDTWCCSLRSYIYWLDVDDHAWRLQQGDVPAASRPLIADLNALLTAHTGSG